MHACPERLEGIIEACPWVLLYFIYCPLSSVRLNNGIAQHTLFNRPNVPHVCTQKVSHTQCS